MSSIVLEFHKLFNSQKRYYFPFQEFRKEIPLNGIYIIFELGEKYQEFDRIVRVGTHTGNNQLYSRLKEHFIKENKNRSIFRKNIGRCILNKSDNPYLKIWDLDTTSAENKRLYSHLVNIDFEKQVEKQISKYIQENLSFCVLKVDNKEQRLFWESKIASTLAQAHINVQSSQWLGNYSPKEKIKTSGLWQVNGLDGECLNRDEFHSLMALIASKRN
jgi:hypothetical protein